MLKAEKDALELINIKKTVSTAELCSRLSISESTARRVLSKLSQRGLIQRYHGGGHSNYFNTQSKSIHDRIEQQGDKKERIARAAARFVSPNQTIVMMGGSTVYKMCKYIRELKITVITTSILIFDELKDLPNIEIILLGGKYNSNEMEVSGVLTSTNFRLLRADTLFMGTTTFHPSAGFLTLDVDSVELYRACINATDMRYVLTDSTKLSTKGLAVTATCEMIHTLITDSEMPAAMADSFEKQGVSVILA